MACKYFLRFVGTDDSSPVYATASAAGSAVAIEIGIYANEPKPQFEGDDREYLGGNLEPSNIMRNGFEIECFPFSTFQAADGVSIVQNTNTLTALRALFAGKKYVWLALPAAPRLAPPRWRDSTNFPLIAAQLPLRVVRDGGFDATLNKDLGQEEVTLNLKAREL